MEKIKEEKIEEHVVPCSQTQLSRTGSYSLKDKLLMALIIIGIISLGLLAINQFINFRYSSLLLQAPCDICRELNPSVDNCIKEMERTNVNNKYNFNFTLDSDSSFQEPK